MERRLYSLASNDRFNEFSTKNTRRKRISLRTAYVSPRSSPLRNAERGETSVPQTKKECEPNCDAKTVNSVEAHRRKTIYATSFLDIQEKN